MKKSLICGLLMLIFTISAVAQKDTLLVCKVVLQLNEHLRNIDLLRAQKDKAEENTYKFYDTVISQFFDSVTLKHKIAEDTILFSQAGKIDLIRLLLNQYHWYLLITPNDSLLIKYDRKESNADLYFVTITYKGHKGNMDFGFWVNPLNNKITAITNSAFTFQGREEEIKSLNSKLHK